MSFFRKKLLKNFLELKKILLKSRSIGLHETSFIVFKTLKKSKGNSLFEKSNPFKVQADTFSKFQPWAAMVRPFCRKHLFSSMFSDKKLFDCINFTKRLGQHLVITHFFLVLMVR